MDAKFWKFILVGIANTIFGITVMFVFYNVFHFSYWFSSASNYVLGSILSYFLNKYFTFKNTERSLAVVARFVINIAVCYGIAYGLARPLVKLVLSSASVTVRDNVAMLVGMCLFVGLNYLGQRFFAFREKPKDAASDDGGNIAAKKNNDDNKNTDESEKNQ